MSRDTVCEEVDYQDPTGDKQHSSLCVHIVSLSTLDIAGHSPGQVGHTLHSQLFGEILLRGGESNKESILWSCSS